MYGVGGRPPERRAFESVAGGQRFDVDYPPLSVWAVGLAGRLYRALAPDMRDSAVFTACVKLPPLLAEIGLAWLVFASVRRLAGGIDIKLFDIALKLGSDAGQAALVQLELAGGADHPGHFTQCNRLGLDPQFLHFVEADLELPGGSGLIRINRHVIHAHGVFPGGR